MNILLTGGTGFIGTELCKHLRNHNLVTVLTRTPEKVYCNLGHDIKPVTSLEDVDFNKLDAVINLAGEPIADKRWSNKQKQKITDSRWQITEYIAKAIKKAYSPPHTLISGSAIGYYGRQGHVPITEEFDNFHQEFSHDVCNKWENLASQATSDRTRVCILRTGVVLGHKGGALKKMLPAYKVGLGGPIASGKQYMSWIHLKDMVGIIMYLLETRELNGIFNATAPNPVSNEEFSHQLAKTLSRPNFARVPAPVLKLLFGEMSDLLLYGQNVVPQRLMDSGYPYRYPTLNEALRNINNPRH